MTEKCTKPEKFTKSFAKESTNTLNDTEEHDRNQHMSDILTYQQPPRFQKRRTKRNPRPPTTDQPEEMEATQDTQVNTKNITPNTRSTTGVTRLILLLTLILVFAACAVCFCDHRFSPETNWPNQWQTETHRSENKSEQIKETSYQLRLCNLKNKKLKTFAIYAVCRFDRRFPPKTNWAKQWQKDPHRNENKSAQIKETPYRVRLCNPKNETVTTKLLKEPRMDTCLQLIQVTQTTQLTHNPTSQLTNLTAIAEETIQPKCRLPHTDPNTTDQRKDRIMHTVDRKLTDLNRWQAMTQDGKNLAGATSTAQATRHVGRNQHELIATLYDDAEHALHNRLATREISTKTEIGEVLPNFLQHSPLPPTDHDIIFTRHPIPDTPTQTLAQQTTTFQTQRPPPTRQATPTYSSSRPQGGDTPQSTWEAFRQQPAPPDNHEKTRANATEHIVRKAIVFLAGPQRELIKWLDLSLHALLHHSNVQLTDSTARTYQSVEACVRALLPAGRCMPTWAPPLVHYTDEIITDRCVLSWTLPLVYYTNVTTTNRYMPSWTLPLVYHTNVMTTGRCMPSWTLPMVCRTDVMTDLRAYSRLLASLVRETTWPLLRTFVVYISMLRIHGEITHAQVVQCAPACTRATLRAQWIDVWYTSKSKGKRRYKKVRARRRTRPSGKRKWANYPATLRQRAKLVTTKKGLHRWILTKGHFFVFPLTHPQQNQYPPPFWRDFFCLCKLLG